MKRLTDIKAEKQGGIDDWIVLFYIKDKKSKLVVKFLNVAIKQQKIL